MLATGSYVYIMSNDTRTVLYIGVTANLSARSYEHKHEEGSTFTKRYNCTGLIYYEFYDAIEEAIKREKVLKKWNRAWKITLIKGFNPTFKDLYGKAADLK